MFPHTNGQKIPPLKDVLFSAWPTVIRLRLDGSLETHVTFHAVEEKKIAQKRLLEQQLLAFLSAPIKKN